MVYLRNNPGCRLASDFDLAQGRMSVPYLTKELHTRNDNHGIPPLTPSLEANTSDKLLNSLLTQSTWAMTTRR